MVNFTDALNTKVGDVERPPLLPIGEYTAKVAKVPTMDTIAQDRFDVCDFTLQITGVVEADEDDITEFGNVVGQNVRHRFMFNKEDETNFQRSLFNLRRFLEEHLKCCKDKDDLKVALNNSVGADCTIQVRHRPDPQDAEIKYVEVARTAPIE